MNFSLIICTFKRAIPLLTLLESIELQTVYPNQILIIDGSSDDETSLALVKNNYKNLEYHKVDSTNRGLTNQRNFGINKVSETATIVCFLDDDTVLETDYFEQILETYTIFPDALGVGGYINNEIQWETVKNDFKPSSNEFYFDGYKRKDGSRFILRKKLGLDSTVSPGFLPEFSHGRSISFLPPSGKIYNVEQLMGGVSSFPKKVFDNFKFSTFFEGYGLYEDADFTLRLSKAGKLYVNTNAKLAHYHNESGRPNKYNYGKMVVRNGWYVWRVKYPKPSLNAIVKWHLITLLLAFIRLFNSLTDKNKKEAFTEFLGRIVGWFSIIFRKPQIK
ncbi:MAG: glycosyltransferase family 2 protein [Flavobacterium sp.]|nr:glycosyltransferase family 2 protein [Flavobacterium sp.]